MRTLFVFLAVSAWTAGAAGVAAAQDDRGGLSQAAYHGPFLSWAGKTAPPTETQPQAAPPPADETETLPPPPRPLPPPAPERSNYVAPPPTYAPPPAEHADDVQPPPVAPPPPAPPPRRVAADQAPAPRQALADASQTNPPPQGRVGVRFYSLHREYGLTPDPITLPKNRPMVLVGPGDGQPKADPADEDAGDKTDGQHPDPQNADN